MPRLAILLMALLIGAAAPARAWCEASCVAPASNETHCPTHDPVSTGTAISATPIENCPAIESARLTTIARVELKAAIVTIESPQFTPTRSWLAPLAVARQATTVFQRHTPLRI